MKFTIFTLLLMTFLSSSVFAEVHITKMKFNKDAHKGVITLHYKGLLNGYPELKITGKEIKVSIPDSKVNKRLMTSASFSTSTNDASISAYSLSRNSSELKAALAFNVQKIKDKVALTIKDNRIELSFPRIKVAVANTKKPIEKVKKKEIVKTSPKSNVKKEFLDEKYLDNLLDVKGEKVKKVAKIEGLKSDKALLDQVTSKQAAPLQPKQSNQISLVEYGGKFVAFLGFVLLLFYGVIVVMKKGFIKKGKLGFLNNADQISVVSQTYIGPKKSLMLIKAHNQVFLVSNTEQGIHPISEIKDAAGLFKAGEKELSGHNFDTNLEVAEGEPELDKKIVLKEDITKSNKESSLSSYLNVKEKVSFSDQLKKKVKNLKPLQ